MEISKLVAGRVIEQRGNKVITVQGGVVSSYDLRYYSLPSDPEFADAEEESDASLLPSGLVVLPPSKRYAFFRSHERGGKKSAHHA